MNKFKQIIILGLLSVIFVNCNSYKTVKTKKNMPFFPAQINQSENFYSVQITADVGGFFAKEFRKHGLYGNGYCWAGIVEQLIEKKQKELLSKINFDPEADTCFISCDDENSMNELAKFINSELSTKEKFSQAILLIDKSKLDC